MEYTRRVNRSQGQKISGNTADLLFFQMYTDP